MQSVLVNKAPQNDLDAERAVLGAMVIENDVIHIVAGIVQADMFYLKRHYELFNTILECYEQNKSVDFLILKSALEAKTSLDKIGGLEYLLKIEEGTPIAANVEHYATTVKDKYARRRIAETGHWLAQCAGDNGDTQHALGKAEEAIYALSTNNSKDTVKNFKTILNETMDNVAASFDNPGAVGLPTGKTDIDKRTGGLQPGDLIIVAARPSMGKTTLALNFASHAALKLNKSVLVFSLEMASTQLCLNMLSMDNGLDSHMVRSGKIDKEEYLTFLGTTSKFADVPIFIDDTFDLNIDQLRAKARKLATKNNIELIILDYLQLLEGKGENRNQEISRMSRGLKSLAKELDVPVIALSQLNRGSEARPDRRPRMADLRDSGAIEQDADVIMLLHRGDSTPNICEVNIVKQRNGPTCLVRLGFEANCLKFYNLAPEEY